MKVKRLSTPCFTLILLLASIHLGASLASAIPGAEGLDVNAIASDPFAYSGEITVRGGVMSVDSEKNQFQIIDYREYRGCGVVTCALKWMTVLSNEKIPAVKDVVEVKGVIEKNDSGKGGFVLKAAEIKVKK
ncbi:hypothetical protein [Desulfoferrobacter suflitae]|uniref:hypothetical protein n=1 Tax=Desulfoferrobacter suflitae TaxID=2865782 RepID=UPI00216417B5|nr:hypothetical protein [Desulfoferrobacter suflitae]MCK8604212.1 hypothetical protein [Desulfoferrobacter suflitae]MDY0042367.1 hypothetical protein [Desulforhabdus sp.]